MSNESYSSALQVLIWEGSSCPIWCLTEEWTHQNILVALKSAISKGNVQCGLVPPLYIFFCNDVVFIFVVIFSVFKIILTSWFSISIHFTSIRSSFIYRKEWTPHFHIVYFWRIPRIYFAVFFPPFMYKWLNRNSQEITRRILMWHIVAPGLVSSFSASTTFNTRM